MKNRRILSILMAVCMVASSFFASLTYNGSVYRVLAANVDEGTEILSLDFEESEGSTPTGWVESATSSASTEDQGKSSMLVVSDNKVAKVAQTAARTKAYDMSYAFEGTKKAELEYRFKAVADSKHIYLPVLAYADMSKTVGPLNLYLNGTALEYGSHRGVRKSATTLTLNEWYTIKMVVDLEQGTRELYVNGEQIALDAENMAEYACDANQTMNSITVGIWRSSGGGEVYLDDMTVRSSEGTEILSLNFEETEGSTPTGWVESATSSASTEDQGKSSMLVVSDNKVAKVAQTATRTKGYDISYQFKDKETQKAELEYRFKAVKASGYIYMPVLTYKDETFGPLNLCLEGGTALTYGSDRANRKSAASLALNEWHTIRMVVDLVQGTRELYVDGNQITLEANNMANCDATTTMDNITVGIYRQSSGCEIYLDDMTARSFVVEEDTAVEIPFVLDFEGLATDVTPEGWTEGESSSVAATEGKASMLVVSDGNNKVAKVTHTNGRSKNYDMSYAFKGTTKAELEYRFKAETASGSIYLPGLAYAGSSAGPLNVFLGSGTNLEYGSQRDPRVKATTLTLNEWHTVRMIVDLETGVRELYVDGEWIALDAANMASKPCDATATMDSINFGLYRNGGDATFYLDDMKVKSLVDGEAWSFSVTDIELPMNASTTLQPSFTPENTSIKGVTYVSSKPEIATVDAYGVITGVAEGETTITATPSLSTLQPIEIKVTVGGELQGSIEVEDTEVSLPIGGHTYLDASLSFNDGVLADDTIEYVSSNTNVAMVDEWGEVLAVAEGTAKITITSVANPKITKEIPVTVEASNVWKSIYVSPNGSGDGTSAGTPTTLTGALTQLATIDKSQMTGNIEVILADGYYYQADALALNNAHGGSNGYSVIFKAEADGDDEEPIIGGGIQIQGSSFTENATTGVYEYDLSGLNLSSKVQTRQLFVDNVRATRARSQGTLINAEYLYDADGTNIGFICENTELLGYSNPSDLELVAYNSWVHLRCQVTEIRQSETDENKVELIMDQPGWASLAISADYKAMNPSSVKYYENALELLDEAGEWYLDETNQKLYYMPRLWEDMDTVEITIPVLDGEMITIIGESSENQVQNICFDGITFADTTWMRPSSNTGHAVNQNNYLRDTNPNGLVDAAITVKKANSVDFVNCTFTRLGVNAINMIEGTQNCLISGNHFYDISGNAIAIGGPDHTTDVDNYNPSDARKVIKNCDVLNNYIHDIGVDFLSSSAISIGFAANLDFCNNEIFHVPYCGFHLGYGWDNKFESITKNVKVSNNFIHDYMLDGVYDGGGVYTNGPTAGSADNYNIVTGNYLRNQGDKVSPLYADEGSTYWRFTNNVVDTSENPVGIASLSAIGWGFVNTGCRNILFDANYTSTHRYSGASAEKNIVFENNTTVEDLNWPAEAMNIIEASGLQNAYSGLRNNQAERIITTLPEDGLGLKVGSTFNIQVTATDGKDRVVSLQDAKVAYEIVDETIATVSDDGTITAIKDGQTLVRVYVVSNNILDVIERELYVGDDVASLCLKDIEGEISLYLDSEGIQLYPYGVTEQGREIDFEKVTYEVTDTNIATVDENGYLKAVAAGETSLKVSGEVNGATITGEFKVIIKQPLVAQVHDLEEIFLTENADQWQGATPAQWEVVEGEKITTTLSGFRTFTGKKYQNELLTFKMSIDDVGTWPSIVFRAQAAENYSSATNSTYIICIDDNGMQVQRYNGGERTVFYGTVTGYEPICGGDIYPHVLSDGELHTVQLGAVNEADGVRLMMYVDGEEIFNFLDDSEDAITEAGYFGLIGRNDVFVLEKMGEDYTAGLNSLTDEVTIGETVNVNVAVGHSKDAVFATGEVMITYDAAKLSFNEEKSKEMLNGATVAYDNAVGTLTLEDYGKDKPFGNAVYTLAFDTKAAGEAAVSISSAAFLDKENAAKDDLMPATISPASVTLTVNEPHSVTLPEGFTGDATVTDGAAYTFSLSEDAEYFNYGVVTATVDGQPVDVTDNGNGTYTIAEVKGVLVISGTRTPKSFTVTVEGTGADDIQDEAATATYGKDYTFTMPKADGFAYKLESLMIGGVDVTNESVYTVNAETNEYTIKGSAIKGVIVMNISKTATKAGVTVNGSGASAAAGYNVSATIGEDYTLTIVPKKGWTYVVTATMKDQTATVIDNNDNTYTIKNVTGPIVFTVEKSVIKDGFEVSNYLTTDGSIVWLVKNATTLENGEVYTYDGKNMFWSKKYQAYCYLVIADTLSVENAKSVVSIADGTAVTVDYGMDVNMSGKVDASDAQLTYNIYNAMYSEFTQDVTVEKFLRADVNGDTKVNVEDAAAIITYILEN